MAGVFILQLCHTMCLTDKLTMSFEDMANFDHRIFWQRRLLLKEIVSLEELGKTFMGHRRKRKPLWVSYKGVPSFNAYLRAGDDCVRTRPNRE
jgi:hypothetical protein